MTYLSGTGIMHLYDNKMAYLLAAACLLFTTGMPYLSNTKMAYLSTTGMIPCMMTP